MVGKSAPHYSLVPWDKAGIVPSENQENLKPVIKKDLIF
jgi:hypothetical protein